MATATKPSHNSVGAIQIRGPGWRSRSTCGRVMDALEAKGSSETFVTERGGWYPGCFLRTSSRNPASEVVSSTRERKAKTPVSVCICALRHATACCHLWHDHRDVSLLVCRTGGGSQRSPTGEVHAQEGWPIYQSQDQAWPSRQRGLVPQSTGPTLYLGGPRCYRWWETRCDWRLRKRHWYRSIITPRAKQISQRSAPKGGLGCF